MLSPRSTTVSPNWTMAERVYDTESLCVLGKLLYIWVVMNSASLSLAAKEVLQWVLTETLTQKGFNVWLLKEILHQLHKRFT